MPKITRVIVEIEDEGVGPFLRVAYATPLVVKVDIDMGQANGPPVPKGQEHVPNAERIARVLAQSTEPMKRSDIRRQTGLTEGTLNSMLHGMKKTGLIDGHGKGLYSLAARLRKPAAKQNGASGAEQLLALPAPAAGVGQTKTGRAAPGTGLIVLIKTLHQAPLQLADVRKHMVGSGVSEKSIPGVIQRARRDKYVKREQDGMWHLTDKGRKHEGVSAHG